MVSFINFIVLYVLLCSGEKMDLKIAWIDSSPYWSKWDRYGIEDKLGSKPEVILDLTRLYQRANEKSYDLFITEFPLALGGNPHLSK